MSNNTQDLENVLDGLEEAVEDCDDAVTVGAVLDAFAGRSFGALLTMIALVAALPIIGAIPGVSIITGTLIILVAGQFLIGRSSPWAPDRLRDLSVEPDKLRTAVDSVRPYAARIDSVIRPRMTALTKGPVARTGIAVLAIALALLFYPLALVPGGVWAPSLAIVALGLALVGNDGALTILGLVGAAATLGLLFWLA